MGNTMYKMLCTIFSANRLLVLTVQRVFLCKFFANTILKQ